MSLKSLFRSALRSYLTYTPIRLGRYPLMMLLHPLLSEKKQVEVETKDRGRMLVDLEDWTQYTLYYNLYEAKYLKTITALVAGTDTVLDVGGNIGQHALLFAKYAKKVYTVEPWPRMIERLRKHIAMNHLEKGVELIPFAASTQDEELTFSYPETGLSGTASTVVGREENTAQIKVKAVRLDAYLTAKGVTKLDLIKLDIEGAELFALKGLESFLSASESPILIMEVNDLMMGKAGYSAQDLREFLAKFGYEPYEITFKGLSVEDPSKSDSENFAFLTKKHLQMPKVKSLLN